MANRGGNGRGQKKRHDRLLKPNMECPTVKKAVVRWVPTPNACTMAYLSSVP